MTAKPFTIIYTTQDSPLCASPGTTLRDGETYIDTKVYQSFQFWRYKSCYFESFWTYGISWLSCIFWNFFVSFESFCFFLNLLESFWNLSNPIEPFWILENWKSVDENPAFLVNGSSLKLAEGNGLRRREETIMLLPPFYPLCVHSTVDLVALDDATKKQNTLSHTGQNPSSVS